MSEREEPEEHVAETSEISAAEESAPVEAQAARSTQHKVRRTRTSGVWTAVAIAAVVLLLLLIFILQNLKPVTVTYFGAQGRLPLGVGLLLAAVGGALVVLVSGVARILQLRRIARRHRRPDKTTANEDSQ